MKKYVFIILALSLLASVALRAWAAAAGLALGTFAWLAWETQLRTRFRFVQGRGHHEAAFELGAECAHFEVATDGSCAVFATLDGSLSMRAFDGREIWKRPSEPGILALLPLPGGACIYALGSELVRVSPQGNVEARMEFDAPPFRQSYRLLAGPGGVLLHTPWFLQFFHPDLSEAGQRIRCEDTGHYMKYAAWSVQGDRVFFAGAKLLEEEQSTEARWGSWKLDGGAWVADWADAADHYGNSHLRGLGISRDGTTLSLEIYHERYEARLLNKDGSLRLKKESAEHPAMSPDASLLAWESQADGLVLGDGADFKKIWIRKTGQRIRHKAVAEGGDCLVIEGRSLLRLNRDGAPVWEGVFRTDPFRISASADGSTLALLRQGKAAIFRFPQ